jgi:hypothetical protein
MASSMVSSFVCANAKFKLKNEIKKVIFLFMNGMYLNI